MSYCANCSRINESSCYCFIAGKDVDPADSACYAFIDAGRTQSEVQNIMRNSGGVSIITYGMLKLISAVIGTAEKIPQKTTTYEYYPKEDNSAYRTTTPKRKKGNKEILDFLKTLLDYHHCKPTTPIYEYFSGITQLLYIFEGKEKLEKIDEWITTELKSKYVCKDEKDKLAEILSQAINMRGYYWTNDNKGLYRTWLEFLKYVYKEFNYKNNNDDELDQLFLKKTK